MSNGLKLSGTVQNWNRIKVLQKQQTTPSQLDVNLFLPLHDFRDIKGHKFGVGFVLICRNIAH